MEIKEGGRKIAAIRQQCRTDTRNRTLFSKAQLIPQSFYRRDRPPAQRMRNKERRKMTKRIISSILDFREANTRANAPRPTSPAAALL
jgi:hypothetical protein